MCGGGSGTDLEVGTRHRTGATTAAGGIDTPTTTTRPTDSDHLTTTCYGRALLSIRDPYATRRIGSAAHPMRPSTLIPDITKPGRSACIPTLTDPTGPTSGNDSAPGA